MIVCECGHGIEKHNYKCRAKADNRVYPAQCSCGLSHDAVEARYWARRMMAERNEIIAKWNDTHVKVYDERDALEAKLDEAAKAMKRIKVEIGGNSSNWIIAQDVLAKIGE